MKIVTREEIFLDENELSIWDRYDQLLDSMLAGSNDSEIIRLIQEIQSSMFDLADYINVEEN